MNTENIIEHYPVENTNIKNSFIDLPEEVRAHILGFISNAELRVFGKTNKKIHIDTRAVTFIRTVHSATRMRPCLETLLKNWEQYKEHRVLESILTKLGTNESIDITFNFITSIDTSSLKNFNESISWLNGDYTDDDEWINMLFPNPRWNHTHINWSKDEHTIVDRWLNDFNEYWDDYIPTNIT